MFFHMPTLLYTETNALYNHKDVLAQYGKKALLVTGNHSAASCGAQADVTGILDEYGIPYAVYNQIEENPSIETVEKAAAFGKEQQADFVIGIGGGSPMDASKAIALLMNHPDKDSSIFYIPRPDLTALPVIAVPTTCGTGSEVTPYAILTDHKNQTKKSISYRIFPKAAFADPRYLKSAPLSVIRNTAVDALGHLIESYINAKATPYSKMLCEYGMKTWALTEASLLKGEFTSTDYNNLTIASTMAGMAISHTGTSLPHGMSYPITYHQGIAHGCGVGVFLCSYAELSNNQEIIQAILNLLNFPQITCLKAFIGKLLTEVRLNKKDMEESINALLENQDKLASCPYPVTKEILEKMYRDSITIID